MKGQKSTIGQNLISPSEFGSIRGFVHRTFVQFGGLLLGILSLNGRGGVLEDAPWPRGRLRGYILKSLAWNPQVLENCPVHGLRTALFLEPLKFCWKRQKPRGKFAKTFLCFPPEKIT